jgi:hypothetical protein
MNLTERKALELCAEMWDIIAEQNCEKHVAYSLMRDRHPELPLIISSWCFFCEFDDRADNDRCYNGHCLGAAVWGATGMCMSGEDSPFYAWTHAETKALRCQYAGQIADGCRAILAEMRKAKKKEPRRKK